MVRRAAWGVVLQSRRGMSISQARPDGQRARPATILADAPLVALQYWDRQEASVDGVLGGFGHVSDADIDGSRRFLLKVCSIDASVCGTLTIKPTLPARSHLHCF